MQIIRVKNLACIRITSSIYQNSKHRMKNKSYSTTRRVYLLLGNFHISSMTTDASKPHSLTEGGQYIARPYLTSFLKNEKLKKKNSSERKRRKVIRVFDTFMPYIGKESPRHTRRRVCVFFFFFQTHKLFGDNGKSLISSFMYQAIFEVALATADHSLPFHY